MALKSSWLPAADKLVSGVFVALPLREPDPVGVAEADVSVAPLPLAACLAAFSASRFCLDAEGGMVVERKDGRACLAVHLQ